MTQRHWTVQDLETLPNDDRRYEIIDGELYVTDYQTVYHQRVCMNAAMALHDWCDEAGTGVAMFGPGTIFAEDQAVVPDVIWLTRARLGTLLGSDGMLHGAPELVIEVLSAETEPRDRDVKLKQYSRFGVREYWSVDRKLRQVSIHRREGIALQPVATLLESDALESRCCPAFPARSAASLPTYRRRWRPYVKKGGASGGRESGCSLGRW